MPKLHIFIDGSWLYKVCQGKALKRYTVYNKFYLDFNKLKSEIYNHAHSYDGNCNEIGSAFFVTSLLTLPDDFDSWLGKTICKGQDEETILDKKNIIRTKNDFKSREDFKNKALDAGFDEETIFYSELKESELARIIHKTYQEKQVDTTVVAKLVEYAITQKGDYFALVAGDADMIPAIKVACPEYTENLFLVTANRNETDEENRLTSTKYNKYVSKIPPLYFQNNGIDKIMEGNFIYSCADCHKFFKRDTAIPTNALPHCFTKGCPSYKHG